jgi:hypothetical protein
MYIIIPTTISLLHKLTPKRHNMIKGCLQAGVSIFGHHNHFFCALMDYNASHVKKIITLIKRDLIIYYYIIYCDVKVKSFETKTFTSNQGLLIEN